MQTLFDEVGEGFQLLSEQGREFSSAHRRHKRAIAVQVFVVEGLGTGD